MTDHSPLCVMPWFSSQYRKQRFLLPCLGFLAVSCVLRGSEILPGPHCHGVLTHSVWLGGLDVEVATLPHDGVENLLLIGVQELDIFLCVAKKSPKTLARGQGVETS